MVLLFINLLLHRLHLKYFKTAQNPSNFSMTFSSVAPLGRGIREKRPALAESRESENLGYGVCGLEGLPEEGQSLLQQGPGQGPPPGPKDRTAAAQTVLASACSYQWTSERAPCT